MIINPLYAGKTYRTPPSRRLQGTLAPGGAHYFPSKERKVDFKVALSFLNLGRLGKILYYLWEMLSRPIEAAIAAFIGG